MAALVHQKCLHHATREAVARCPLCASFFCRECVVEHDGRVLCASCLAKSANADERRKARLGSFLLPAGALAGFALAWVFFLALGSILIGIPSSFHDGSWFQRFNEGMEGIDG